MDPLNYDYTYNPPLQYSVKIEPIPSILHPNALHGSIQNVSDLAPNITNPVQNIPSVIQNVPSTVQSLPPPQNLQRSYNVPVVDTNNGLGEYNNQAPGYVDNDSATVTDAQETVVEEDSKEDLKPLLAKAARAGRRRKKPRGKVSTYWNKKVTEANFPFYGCALCNVSYPDLLELDKHMTAHKGRFTSYDLRLKNQRKRKLLRKEQKKLRKLGKKLKKEDDKPKVLCDVEIKPEDGYIGSEKANEFTETNENDNVASNVNGSGQDSGNTNVKDVKEVGEKRDGTSDNDPQLQKLFKCFACQKQFQLGYYLKLHVRSHTDEKPYTCAQCGQSFITASKLGRHNKRIHLAVRYQCRICYRLFTRFEYLVRHFDKKHAEQKLEGEPYDYNAILPYLQELEEQLLQKVEAKEPKLEAQLGDPPETQPWGPGDREEAQPWARVPGDQDDWGAVKQDDTSQDTIGDEVFVQPTMSVVEEDGKIEIEVKKEEPEFEHEVKDESFHAADDLGDAACKDESVSDDDYFPPNTWAAAPEPPAAPAQDPAAPAPDPAAPAQDPAARRTKKQKLLRNFPLKCDHCDKLISTPTYMRVHLRTHTGERPFKCHVCGRGFITSSKMHRHALTHGAVAEEDESIKTEGIKEEPDHPQDGDDASGDTGRKRKSSKKKKLGAPPPVKAKKQYRPRPLACPFCGKRFMHADTLKVHEKSHEGETRILKCHFCLEEQFDEQCLREHEATHVGPRPYPCNECGRSYKKREAMIYHRKTHSAREHKTYVCDICSKTFREQATLVRHIAAHSEQKYTLKYECPVCAHMFNTKYHVEMHLNSHRREGAISDHNRAEILAMVLQNARKIPKPGAAPGASPALTALTTTDERSTVCNICGEVFQHFYILEEHLKSHGSKIVVEDQQKEAERKHVCAVCSKAFKLPYYLKLHTYTHTKEKPFICQQCGKGFITKGKLKRHLETHTGLKKFQCHICYKHFTRQTYLRVHVRTIHGTQDYNFRLDRFDSYSESSPSLC